MSDCRPASSTATAEQLLVEAEKAATKATSRTFKKQKAKKQTKHQQQQQKAQTSPQLQCEQALTPPKTPQPGLKKQPLGDPFYTVGLAEALEAAEASKVKRTSRLQIILLISLPGHASSAMVIEMSLTMSSFCLAEAAAACTACGCLSDIGFCLCQVNFLLGIASRLWPRLEGRPGQLSPEQHKRIREVLRPPHCVSVHSS